MGAARNYRELIAWQKAMDLAVDVYRVAGRYPKEEIYGLTIQTKRSAISVPSNIAEGEGRGNDKEFVHFLRIALGSLCEMETQLLLAERLGYMQPSELHDLLSRAAEVGRLTNGLMQSLRPPETGN